VVVVAVVGTCPGEGEDAAEVEVVIAEVVIKI